MQAQEIESLLSGELEGCQVEVRAEGNHVDVLAIGEMFEGMRPVQKQQAVYRVLNPLIADGTIHAVNIRTYTPAEWQALNA